MGIEVEVEEVEVADVEVDVAEDEEAGDTIHISMEVGMLGRTKAKMG